MTQTRPGPLAVPDTTPGSDDWLAHFAFEPIRSEEEYRFSYEVLVQRARLSIVDAAFHLPSFEEHCANVRSRFATYHGFRFQGALIGVAYFRLDYEIGVHLLTRQLIRYASALRQLRIRHLGMEMTVAYIRLIKPARFKGKAYHLNPLALDMDRRIIASPYVTSHYHVRSCENDGYVCYDFEWKLPEK